MSEPRNAPLPGRPPNAPSVYVTRALGFLVLGGTMWLAGLLALMRSIMSLVGP